MCGSLLLASPVQRRHLLSGLSTGACGSLAVCRRGSLNVHGSLSLPGPALRSCLWTRSAGCAWKLLSCPGLLLEAVCGPGTAAGSMCGGWLCTESLSLSMPALRNCLWNGPAARGRLTVCETGSQPARGSLLLLGPTLRSCPLSRPATTAEPHPVGETHPAALSWSESLNTSPS